MGRGRHGARRLALQALYQYQLAGHSLDELQAQFSAAPEFAAVDQAYFTDLLQRVLSDVPVLDADLAETADRPLEQLDPVARAVLWIGAAELRSYRDIPVKVIINESVELAKEFGAEQSFKYINAMLDRIAGLVRDG